MRTFLVPPPEVLRVQALRLADQAIRMAIANGHAGVFTFGSPLGTEEAPGSLLVVVALGPRGSLVDHLKDRVKAMTQDATVMQGVHAVVIDRESPGEAKQP